MLRQPAEQIYAGINSVLHYLGGGLCLEATDTWHMLIATWKKYNIWLTELMLNPLQLSHIQEILPGKLHCDFK